MLIQVRTVQIIGEHASARIVPCQHLTRPRRQGRSVGYQSRGMSGQRLLETGSTGGSRRYIRECVGREGGAGEAGRTFPSASAPDRVPPRASGDGFRSDCADRMRF